MLKTAVLSKDILIVGVGGLGNYLQAPKFLSRALVISLGRHLYTDIGSLHYNYNEL